VNAIAFIGARSVKFILRLVSMSGRRRWRAFHIATVKVVVDSQVSAGSLIGCASK